MTISENIVLTARNQAKGAFGELDRDVRQAIGSMGKFNTSGNQAFISGLQKSNTSLANFGNMLVDAADKAGLGTSEISKMAGASGIFSESQIVAARASGAMAVKANELALAVSKGEMTTRAAGRAFREFADQTRTATGGAKLTAESLTGLATKAAAAGAILTGFGVALKTGFDFARAGAQIELAEIKFDRLATSIGTSGDALLNDIQVTARGLMSNAQLMRSAGDLMGLGLAKTHDQAVRLTNVAARLGMDMNQLVLTLTNQTTMRFDALGVSVDGFNQKVDDLKAAGYGVQEAFTEAFLQQAEDQIERVGDISETSAGKIARFDSSISNLGDAIKTELAGPLSTAADALATLLSWTSNVDIALQKHNQEVLAVSGSYRDYAAEILRANVVAGRITQSQADMILALIESSDGLAGAQGWALQATNELMPAIGLLTDAEYELARAEMERKTQTDQATGATQRSTGATRLAAQATYEYVYQVSDVDQEARRAAQAVQNFGQKVEESGDAAATSSGPVKGYLDGIDRNIASPIAAFIQDLKWMAAGGSAITLAFEQLKLQAPTMDPEDVKKQAEELFVSAIDLDVTLDPTTMQANATLLKDTLGAEAARIAMQEIRGTEGIAGALRDVTSVQYFLDFYARYHGLPAGTYVPPSGGNGGLPGGSSNQGGGGGSSGGGGGTYNPGGGAVGVQSIIPPAGGEVMVPIGGVAGGSGAGVGAVGGVKTGGDLFVELTINAVPGMSPEDVAAMTVKQLDAARRAWAAGAGYVG